MGLGEVYPGVTLRLLEKADLDTMPTWVGENLTKHLCACMNESHTELQKRNYWLEILIIIAVYSIQYSLHRCYTQGPDL